MKLLCRVWLAVQLLLVGATGALPHALQPGFLDLEAAGQDVWRVTWRVPDLNGAPMPLRPLLPDGCDIREPGQLRFDGAAHVAQWRATCPFGIAGGTVTVAGLENTQTDVLVRFQLAPGNGGTLRLTASQTTAAIPEIPTRAGVLGSYVALGVEHILGGIDHLLFVFALLLLVPDARRLVWSITAFTLAHSLTLVSATLGWLVVPSPPVEVVIALSIMFLAADLARPGGAAASVIVTRPWIASFGFGLLHGLGFAGALVEIGLPRGEVPLALFSFNLGVEIGQLLFVAAVLAALYVLSLPRLFPGLVASVRTPGRIGRVSLAYAIGTVSAVWFLSRLAAF